MWTTEARIGRGGTATVHRARRDSDGCQAAIKTFSGHCSHLVDDETEVLRHLADVPGIAHLVTPDLDGIDDLRQIAIEYVPGAPLNPLLPATCDYQMITAAVLAETLAAVHAAGVVHNDVKYENVIMSDGSPVLIDFGGARLMGQSRGLDRFYGTPEYGAPERWSGVDTDPASDVYALGVTLYELLTGELPWPEPTRRDPESWSAIHTTATPLQRGLRDGDFALIGDMMARDPRDRPTAAEVVDLIDARLGR